MNTNTRASIIRKDPLAVRITVITLTLLFFALFIFAPLGLVFAEAFRKGAEVYFASLVDPAALSAIQLTLTVSLIVVPLNTIFGLFAAYAITKFNFRGKAFLSSLIDLPFAVSPVVAGLIFVLLVGARTPLGGWLADHDIKIIFAVPGIIIATIFVTFPFVARELVPVMQALGKDSEESAITLGANGWQMFFRVTLPSIRWGLLYGIVLCNARAIGEFGAVSVVSGHIRGQTNTIPLHVEILYSEYSFAASFAASSILVFIALITIVARALIERRFKRQLSGH
jgi:sulfate transport system permease protein